MAITLVTAQQQQQQQKQQQQPPFRRNYNSFFVALLLLLLRLFLFLPFSSSFQVNTNTNHFTFTYRRSSFSPLLLPRTCTSFSRLHKRTQKQSSSSSSSSSSLSLLKRNNHLNLQMRDINTSQNMEPESIVATKQEMTYDECFKHDEMNNHSWDHDFQRIRNHYSPFTDPSRFSDKEINQESSIHSDISSKICTILIILNRPVIRNDPSSVNINHNTKCKSLFEHLWETSSLRICADGGANRLYRATRTKTARTTDTATDTATDTDTDTTSTTNATIASTAATTTSDNNFIPDLIVGDLDSLKEHVRDYYKSHGSRIHRVFNQDYNDLDKAMQAVCDYKYGKGCLVDDDDDDDDNDNINIDIDIDINKDDNNHHHSNQEENRTANKKMLEKQTQHPSSSPSTSTSTSPLRICIYGAFGGRLDQSLASIQALHKWTSNPLLEGDDMILYTEETSARLLHPGMTHCIHIEEQKEGPSCGLIPVGRKCNVAWSAGLQWDLDESLGSMEFGGLVSTSNIILGKCVKVRCSDPLIWTTEMRGFGMEDDDE